MQPNLDDCGPYALQALEFYARCPLRAINPQGPKEALGSCTEGLDGYTVREMMLLEVVVGRLKDRSEVLLD